MRSASRSRRSSFLPAGTSGFFKRRVVEIAGLTLCALGVATAAALATYDPADPSWNTAVADGTIRNLLGPVGAYGADLLVQTLGAAAFLIALLPIVWGWRIARHRDLGRLWLRLAGLVCAPLLAATAMAPLSGPYPWFPHAAPGGAIGALSADRIVGALVPHVGHFDRMWIAAVAGALALIALLVAIGLSPGDWRGIGGRVAAVGGLIGRGGRGKRRSARPPTAPPVSRHAASTARREPTLSGVDSAPRGETVDPGEPVGIAAPAVEPLRAKRPDPVVAPKPKPPPAGKRAVAEKQAQLALSAGDYQLPPLDLLALPDPTQQPEAQNAEGLRKNAEILEGVLGDFGVRGEIVRVNPGPVVTLYELEPAPGTKSSRVIGLADDIARSMSAVSVRVAVVPGRNVIGIELPNAKRETVYLRELLASRDYERTSGKLTLVLGKDIAGTPVMADLARMPHLLVAGTTGSGKSVAINTMVLSLLYRLPPEKARLIMIDPKMLELSIYEGIPHLLAPVVTDPKKAVVALKWTVREMEDRYRAMSKVGVRNIEGFNQRLREAKAKGETLTRRVQTGFDPDTGKPIFEDQPFDLTELPYIVVVVDEMADLMMVAGKEIEAAIQRLAQMARAAGVHLIMATQRPSVDVITGTIKANFPTRVSFQVTSRIDSRTILGEMGAEQLLGQGDMLYMAGGGRITRVHGPFVSDEEVDQVVAHLRAQGDPVFNDTVLEEDNGADFDAMTGGANGGDELYDRAVALVARERKASTSFIQRHLQIGYNRAARIIDQMEADGVISGANHVGKREVLVGSGGGE
ncbi:MAG: DNA translocase FtsK 4TM domain-containing protein [Alphaproteobacteria bacterium]